MPVPANASEAIAQRLLTGTAVAALVGARVFPSKPTQETAADYIVYFRQGGGEVKTIHGRSGLQSHEIRIECYSRTQAVAEQILAAVASRLCGDRAAGVAAWRDRTNGVHGCFAQGDGDELVTEDAFQVSGQTFSLWFSPQT